MITFTTFTYVFHPYAPSLTHDPLGSLRLCYPLLCLFIYSSYLLSAALAQPASPMPFVTTLMLPLLVLLLSVSSPAAYLSVLLT